MLCQVICRTNESGPVAQGRKGFISVNNLVQHSAKYVLPEMLALRDADVVEMTMGTVVSQCCDCGTIPLAPYDVFVQHINEFCLGSDICIYMGATPLQSCNQMHVGHA